MSVEYMKRMLVMKDIVEIHVDTFDNEESATRAAALFRGKFTSFTVRQNDGSFKVWVQAKGQNLTPTDLTKKVLSYLISKAVIGHLAQQVHEHDAVAKIQEEEICGLEQRVDDLGNNDV